MGTVYRARRVADGVLVALKVMNAEYSADAVFQERFRREAAALDLVDHPNVVKRLDHGDEDGVLYLVMEWVEGENLHQRMRRQRLTVVEALGIFRQVAAGMAAVHGAGMVHRDLKPANVLLDWEGNVKVADFGLMRRQDQDEPTLTGSVLQGASFYTSPEARRGGKDSTARGDIYSLGALLYDVLAGHPPAFEAPKLAELSLVGCPPQADQVVSRAMSYRAEDRYGSVGEMLVSLEKEPEPLVPMVRQVVVGTSRWRRTGIVAALLVGAAGSAWWYYPRTTSREGKILSKTEQAAMQWPGAVLIKPDRVAVPLPARTGAMPGIAWENSLGMAFRPVPRSAVLMCIWETRIRDFKVHADACGDDARWISESGIDFTGIRGMLSLTANGVAARSGSWRKPGWEIQDDDPVAGPCLIDAMAFCTWLTWEERKSGKITAEQAYRLPTDEEWSAAAGLPLEGGGTPEEHAAWWPASVHVWPWGGALASAGWRG